MASREARNYFNSNGKNSNKSLYNLKSQMPKTSAVVLDALTNDESNG